MYIHAQMIDAARQLFYFNVSESHFLLVSNLFVLSKRNIRYPRYYPAATNTIGFIACNLIHQSFLARTNFWPYSAYVCSRDSGRGN